MPAPKRWDKWISPDGLTLIAGWARQGLTEEDIAKNMGISWRTLSRWKEKFCQIRQALNKNKAVADFRVENALYKRATGCVVIEKRTNRVKDPVTGNVTVTVQETEREVPPDTIAAIFWLKNRQPKHWRDKQELEVSGELGITDALKKARERLNESRSDT